MFFVGKTLAKGRIVTSTLRIMTRFDSGPFTPSGWVSPNGSGAILHNPKAIARIALSGNSINTHTKHRLHQKTARGREGGERERERELSLIHI